MTKLALEDTEFDEWLDKLEAAKSLIRTTDTLLRDDLHRHAQEFVSRAPENVGEATTLAEHYDFTGWVLSEQYGRGTQNHGRIVWCVTTEGDLLQFEFGADRLKGAGRIQLQSAAEYRTLRTLLLGQKKADA